MILILYPFKVLTPEKLTPSPPTVFFFHFFQIFSNFFKYSSLNLLSFHFNFHLLSIPSYHLTSAFNLPLNSSTNSFTFSKSSSLSHVSFSAIKPFHLTKYLSTSRTFLLFNIFSTFCYKTRVRTDFG